MPPICYNVYARGRVCALGSAYPLPKQRVGIFVYCDCPRLRSHCCPSSYAIIHCRPTLTAGILPAVQSLATYALLILLLVAFGCASLRVVAHCKIDYTHAQFCRRRRRFAVPCYPLALPIFGRLTLQFALHALP